MVSRKDSGAAEAATKLLHDKLQLLRSITNSGSATNDANSIIVDASNYIRMLKHRVERAVLSQNMDGCGQIQLSSSSSSHLHQLFPQISVETLEKGLVVVTINWGKSCPSGFLAYILEGFENLGLTVVEARVSCGDTFHLQVLGEHNDEEDEEERVNAQMVKRAISKAIKTWTEKNNE